MKSCTLLFLFLFPFIVFGQTTVFDFEGTPPEFFDFSGSFTQVIANPDAGGINTSSMVGENTVPANTAFSGTVVINQSVNFANGKGFTMQVWSPISGIPVLLKFEAGDGANQEIMATYTAAAGTWQELSFDFSAFPDATYGSITLFFNFNVVTPMGRTYYFDNLVQSVVMPPDAPMTAAPTPTRAAEDVISLYSDAYDDVPVDTYFTPWSQGMVADTNVAGNATKLYTNLDFSGIETLGENAIDLAGTNMTHVHVDIWTPNSDTFRIKLVDLAGDGFGGDNDTEDEEIVMPVIGQWNSFDIPLSDFAMNQSDIQQIIISSLPAGGSTIWLDNLYFYEETMIVGDQMDLPVTFDDPEVIYAFIDFAGAVSAFAEDPEETGNTVIQTTKVAGAETFAGTTLSTDDGMGGNPGFATAIPFTEDASVISVRVWSPAAGVTVRLKVEDSDDNTVSVETETLTTQAMAWETLEFEFKNEAAGTAAINYASEYNKLTIFFDFGTVPTADATYFWDDIIFTGTTTVVVMEAVPMVAAPTPDEEEEFVISLFSDAYTDVPVDTWRTDWSSSTFEDIEIAGNATKKYTALDFNGIETVTSPIDLEAAGMMFLHVDVWTPNSTLFRIKLVDFGGDGFGGGNDTEVEPVFALEQEEWNSLDISLADSFSTMNLSDINQFIISSLPTGSSTIYLDNVYFYRMDPDGVRTPVLGLLDAFPNPARSFVTVTAPAQMEKLTLYNTNGQIVGQWQPNSERFNVPMDRFPVGIYVALVSTGDRLMTVRVVKE